MKEPKDRERMNERRIRCHLHGTRCIVAEESCKKPTRRGRHGSHDRRGKDHRRGR